MKAKVAKIKPKLVKRGKWYEIETPEFRSYKEEAEWWDNNGGIMLTFLKYGISSSLSSSSLVRCRHLKSAARRCEEGHVR